MNNQQTIITTITLEGPAWAVNAITAICERAAWQRVKVEMSVVESGPSSNEPGRPRAVQV